MYYRVTTYSFDAARRDEFLEFADSLRDELSAVDGLEAVHTPFHPVEVVIDDGRVDRRLSAHVRTDMGSDRRLGVRAGGRLDFPDDLDEAEGLTPGSTPQASHRREDLLSAGHVTPPSRNRQRHPGDAGTDAHPGARCSRLLPS